MKTLNVFTMDLLAPCFELLEALQGVQQMEKHHPEGDAFNHSLQVFRHAIRETDDVDLILAALLHDVGKQVCKAGHEKETRKLLGNYCVEKVLWLIENHMRVWTFIEGKMKRPGKARTLAEHPWFSQLVQLGRWDKMGREKGVNINCDWQRIVDILNEKAALHFRWEGQNDGLNKSK